jgi:hypothetical protein
MNAGRIDISSSQRRVLDQTAVKSDFGRLVCRPVCRLTCRDLLGVTYLP